MLLCEPARRASDGVRALGREITAVALLILWELLGQWEVRGQVEFVSWCRVNLIVVMRYPVELFLIERNNPVEMARAPSR